jgi:hypothetical protein
MGPADPTDGCEGDERSKSDGRDAMPNNGQWAVPKYK